MTVQKYQDQNRNQLKNETQNEIFYEPNYEIRDRMVYIYNDQQLTTLEFMDKVSLDNRTSNFIQILRSFHLSFAKVPSCVTKLKINGCRLYKLDGISKMNLKELDLSDNNIIDISELKNFRLLETLNLSYNLIEDISILELQGGENKLHVLNKLHLNDNRIINIDALESQYTLQYVNLNRNFIQNFSPIKDRIYREYYGDGQQKLDSRQQKFQQKYIFVRKVEKMKYQQLQKKKQATSGCYKFKQHQLTIIASAQYNLSLFMSKAVTLLQQLYYDLTFEQ
ncbi:Sec7_domain-containing protein [Hexamita inflata]|uniref:Sec7_domain-containing protein n=1 Tax=Hexamita inflata TaxID=28002 RepID=A0ABP1HBJ9_9EUKA